MTKMPANINGSKVVIVITDPKDDGGAMASTVYLRHGRCGGVTFTTIWPDPDGSYSSDANVETVNSTVFGGIKEQP